MNVLRKVFFFSCAALILFNTYQLIQTLTPARPVHFAGMKFSGLENILKTETHIGYLTDFDLKETGSLAEYEQAQYVLAPAILDANNADHRFLILNFSNDTAALAKLKEIGAHALTRNNFGVILARRDDRTSNNTSSKGAHSP